MSWIDETIEDGKKALRSADREAMEEFLRNATKRMEFEDIPHPRKGLNYFKQRMTTVSFGGRCSVTPPEPNEEDIKNDVHIVLRRLEEWKEMMFDPTSKAGKHSIENHNVNINNVNALADSSSSSSAQVDLSVTIEAIESSDLTEDQIKELKALMLDLSAAKGKDAKTVAEKLKNALDVAKSSTGAAKAIMEFAIPIIQSIL